MRKLDRFLIWFDSLFPNPWIVEGTVQMRPVKQLGFMIGVLLTVLIIKIFF